MIELLKPCYLVLIKYAVLILSVIFVLFKFRQSGKESIINKNTYATLKAVKFHDNTKDRIDNLSDAQRKRLRKRWQRD